MISEEFTNYQEYKELKESQQLDESLTALLATGVAGYMSISALIYGSKMMLKKIYDPSKKQKLFTSVVETFLHSLADKGVIKNFRMDGSRGFFSFKNAIMKISVEDDVLGSKKIIVNNGHKNFTVEGASLNIFRIMGGTKDDAVKDKITQDMVNKFSAQLINTIFDAYKDVERTTDGD